MDNKIATNEIIDPYKQQLVNSGYAGEPLEILLKIAWRGSKKGQKEKVNQIGIKAQKNIRGKKY